jgi:hypothetical protein
VIRQETGLTAVIGDRPTASATTHTAAAPADSSGKTVWN